MPRFSGLRQHQLISAMIEFRDVSVSFGSTPVFERFNFTIERGEFVTVVGPSGSGKSTLVRLINRMVPLDSGAVYFNGVNTADLEERALRLQMGYALQGVGLFPHWTVARNIGTVPALLGWDKQRIAARVEELLHLFRLDPADFAHRLPHQLSGGQAQRVGVARALAGDPEVLLMDEPFGALDPITRVALRQEMKQVHALAGKTTVMVTHDIEEALTLGTRVLVLQNGKVVQAATPLELVSQPASPWVADFLGKSELGLQALALQTVASRLEPVSGPLSHSVPATASLRDAVSLMAQHRVGLLGVVDSKGDCIGQLCGSRIFEP
jgi:osmoprotectant transport system ATP-binding protein